MNLSAATHARAAGQDIDKGCSARPVTLEPMPWANLAGVLTSIIDDEESSQPRMNDAAAAFEGLALLLGKL